MSLLEKLGQDPQRSMRRFLCGLGLFIFGLGMIFIGYYHSHLWQIIGLAVIALAILIASFGYIGLFANRLYHLLNRHKH
ncbi:hypothetical protein [Colwellia chukchiensis]|uniref:hypothetical protein n=1 Tax=Colwellia chukchiensis TaxID=641665 RepID=UPI000A1743D4|nr:hypothetical protein [Colwellia chukchiensis]